MAYLLLAAVLLAYVLVTFVLVPRIVPLMGRSELPARIPQQLSEAAKQLASETRTKYELVQAAAYYLLSQNHGGRFSALMHARLAFESHVSKLLRREGFMHAHHLNYLLRILLVESGRIPNEDIRTRVTFFNFQAHEYLQVRIAGQWYDVDLAAEFFHVPLGRHAWGFA